MVLGYMIVDFIHLWKYERVWSFIIHHIMAIVTGSSLKCLNYGGQIFSCVFYVSDITTIMLQFSWYVRDKLNTLSAIDKFCKNNKNGIKYNKKILEKMIHRQKKLKGMLQFVFSLTFFYLRLYVMTSIGPKMAYTHYSAKHIKIYYKVVSVGICVCFLAVGYVWSGFIARRLYLDLFSKSQSK